MGANRPDQAEYLTKVILTVIFLGSLGGFAWWRLSTGQGLDAFHLTVTDLVLLVFATLRMGRMLAYDLVMEPLRAPFTETVPDGTGAGESVEPKGRGVRRAFGQLISCPICAGTWSAWLLVLLLYAWPGPARILVTILGAIGFAEVLNSAVESLSWSGQLARTRTGAILRDSEAPLARSDRSSPEILEEDEEEPDRLTVTGQSKKR